MYLIGNTKTSTTSLRNEGVVVVNLAPSSQVQHIFNGRIVDPLTCAHLHECTWDPFHALETATFFHTYISETPAEFTVVVNLPSYISRYIRVQRGDRTLAVVGKAMAQRRWRDGKAGNVHELWKVYWRLFRVPVGCDLDGVRAWYGVDTLRVVVPRKTGWLHRLLGWGEARLWAGQIRA
ncbi:hypothetical protein IWW57_000080 [Coemansia sp. S610]|nr:hypothetical protein LPJ60_005181 [Coemansia sp. RSA 2675]KAJ2013755.1 hypothetical protein GGI06_003734 [Coemansia sp. S85]KAJ2032696.1 hypothetical protein IWW57_000080 [Coemansia sp. S610]KAJ2371989.1 hypothetical protein H4S02_009360 [Coemansia sp. RSA 2611]KAJ2414539.1 hypothetical protein GGI10_002315 [Coemansia sp. RSA 2530]KAJ2696180.1 hypothetical protein H4218_004773 [Coemansia sp. IMI 209128]